MSKFANSNRLFNRRAAVGMRYVKPAIEKFSKEHIREQLSLAVASNSPGGGTGVGGGRISDEELLFPGIGN